MAKETSISAMDSQIKPTDLARFHAALAKWYKTNGRHDLPWRHTRDPYPIWLSEVMLQQTQVATVRDRYYFPFLKKFPTIEALAGAGLSEVLKAWEGLGYYSRASNLHAAAQCLTTKSLRGHDVPITQTPMMKGRSNPSARKTQRWIASLSARNDDVAPASLPNTLENLLSLPGIGRNTAHAILAFAYHQPVPILEANVKRIVARVFALAKPMDAELWAGAERLMNRKHPFDYNQAMMDMGALICTPKNPQCGACPASSLCKGKMHPEHYPTPKLKKKILTREVSILVREDARGKLYLEPRDAKLLGGLYGFVQLPPSAGERTGGGTNLLIAGLNASPPQAAAAPFPTSLEVIGTISHTYSHFKLAGVVMHEKISTRANSPHWYTREEIRALPLSTLDHKVLTLVDKCHSKGKKQCKSARAAQAR